MRGWNFISKSRFRVCVHVLIIWDSDSLLASAVAVIGWITLSDLIVQTFLWTAAAPVDCLKLIVIQVSKPKWNYHLTLIADPNFGSQSATLQTHQQLYIIKRSFRCGAFKACCNTCQQVQVGNEFIYIYLCLFIFIYLSITSCNFIVLQPRPPYTLPTFFMYKSFWPYCSSNKQCKYL